MCALFMSGVFCPTVNSRSSSSSKYDPDILKAEIATAKSRVRFPSLLRKQRPFLFIYLKLIFLVQKKMGDMY